MIAVEPYDNDNPEAATIAVTHGPAITPAPEGAPGPVTEHGRASSAIVSLSGLERTGEVF